MHTALRRADAPIQIPSVERVLLGANVLVWIGGALHLASVLV